MPTIKAPAAMLRGTVRTVYFASPGFSAGRLRGEDGYDHSFAGKMYIREGDRIVLRGRWKRHPKYGKQLEAESFQYDVRLSSEGLAHYLASHPDMRGIGPARARRIAGTFGEDFESVLLEEPARVAKAAGVPVETALHLRTEWLRRRDFNAAFTALSAYELTHHQVTTLVERFGVSIIGMIEADPFSIAREVPGYGFKRLDQIARKTGTPKDHPGRLRAGIMHCVHERLDDGDCWVEYDELVDQANTLLVLDTMNARALIESALGGLLESKRLAAQPFSSRILVALPDIHAAELELGRLFRLGTGANPHFAGIDDPGSLVTRTEPRLNSRQREAVVRAMEHRLSLIPGGAGSGKTFTVSAIADIYTAKGATVVLCAPTGKAAQRLEQATGRPASTIHRLLGYDGRSFAKGPADTIEADLVVVDEFSMVDVPLAWHLFRALDPRTAVVLVGDHNQLPPVGPGNILRDLVQTRLVPLTVLDEVVRQAGALKENSIAVLRGEVRPTAGPEAGQPRPWYLCGHLTEAPAVREFLLELYATQIEERLGFDLLSDVQLLTPTHKGPLGTRALNAALQRLVQKKRFGLDVPIVPEGHRPRLYTGDKVIQTRNNYKLGVMNGTIGTVLAVGPAAGDYLVRFDGREVAVTSSSGTARDLRLAYALSVHSAQGSEFPCVVAVVHKSHSFMHHRNLLYTAVTRAQRTAILVGDGWGIRNAARKEDVARRHTFLSILPDLELR